jgi:predicted phosphohydrolase
VRFLVGSDLHTEFYKTTEKANRAFPALPPAADYDAVLLAGDIGIGVFGAKWALQYFPEDKPIIYIPGNHEYYQQPEGVTNVDVLLGAQAVYSQRRLWYLNPGVWANDGVIVIGAALWTAFRLKGYPEALSDESLFSRSINDFRLIHNSKQSRYFTPQDSRDLYTTHYAFIEKQIATYAGKLKIVVMTHWVPSQVCIDPRYANDRLNPYFTNDCDDLMDKVKLWVYGHTHSRADQVHPLGARLLGNPFGYPNENPGFTWKIAEV